MAIKATRDKQYRVESRLYLKLSTEHVTMVTAMAQWAAARQDTTTGYDDDGGGQRRQRG